MPKGLHWLHSAPEVQLAVHLLAVPDLTAEVLDLVPDSAEEFPLVDPQAADVFSAGVTLYSLLTGEALTDLLHGTDAELTNYSNILAVVKAQKQLLVSLQLWLWSCHMLLQRHHCMLVSRSSVSLTAIVIAQCVLCNTLWFGNRARVLSLAASCFVARLCVSSAKHSSCSKVRL